MVVMNDNAKTIRTLIVFALVTSTFTLLRFTFLGVGELIFLVLGGFSLLKLWDMPRYKSYMFSGFWLLYLILSIIGGLYNRANNLNTGTLPGAVFDFAAYFMLFISCLSIERRFVFHRDNAYLYLRAIFYFFVGVLSILYFFSFFTNSIAGFQIRYYQYFSPLVKNLHQAAMILTPMPFIGLLILKYEKKVLVKFVTIILIILCVFMIISTGASKAKLGVIMGLTAYGVAVIYRYGVAYAVIAAGVVVSALLYYFMFYADFFSLVTQLFEQHDGKGGRAHLYAAAIELIRESWFLGRGSGPHIFYLGEFNDSHQTLLTVLLQVGIVGFLLFISLFYKILKRSFYFEPAVFSAVFSILAYAAGGDILRRLPIWGLLIILYYWADQMRINQNGSKTQ